MDTVMSNHRTQPAIRFRIWAAVPFLVGLGIICYQGATGVPDMNSTTKHALAAIVFGFGAQVLVVIQHAWQLFRDAPPRVRMPVDGEDDEYDEPDYANAYTNHIKQYVESLAESDYNDPSNPLGPNYLGNDRDINRDHEW